MSWLPKSVAPEHKAFGSSGARQWLLRFGPYGSVLLGLSMVLLIWFGAVYFSYSERAQTEREARQTTDNLTRAFAEQMIRSIRAVDQTLLYVRASYAKDPANFDMSLWTRNSQFLGDFTFQVSVIGKDGKLIASNIPGSSPGVDLSDREHFKVHAERQSDELFISKPILGRVSNKWSLQMTRRITMPDGSFGGVVVVSVDPYYLSQFYDSIDIGKQGVVTLIGDDAIIRARKAAGPSVIGQSLAHGKVFDEITKSDAGFYNTKSVTDGVDRIFAFRHVKGYPLVIAVGLANDEVFEVYQHDRRQIMAVCVLLTLWLFAAIYLMVRYQQQLARARDAAEAGTRARSEFLAMMSHEIRTPMNGVIGVADLLLDSNLNAEQLGYAKTMRNSASHLLQIINDVLDFSKLEADRLEIEKIAFPVGDLVRDTVGLLAGTAQEKGLLLSAAIAPEVPPYVTGDSARLRQVLLNLVGNGLKFTEVGTVTVGVAMAPDSPDGQVRLLFTVADTGIGMPKDALPLLFRKFSQLDSSIARRFGGTGLGLAISKRLIDLMGGTMAVESEVGKGTTFAFAIDYLPAVEPASSGGCEPVQAPSFSPDQAADRKSIRILLTEDNKTNQMVATKLIQGLGYEVDIANNGIEAVAACSTTQYDIVLMDVMMPEMDGFTATRAIRKLPKPYCDPHIIAMTANVQQQDRDECRNAGMDDFLGKPVTRAGIAAKLGESQAVGRFAAPMLPAAAPILDEAAYNELADALGPEGIRMVVDQFISDSEERFKVLREAARNDDRDCVKLEAHTAKGASGSLGFRRFSELAKAFEHEALGLDGSAVNLRLDLLEAAFGEIRTVVSSRRLTPADAVP